MELTQEIMEIGYKHARIYCWKRGRRDVDYRDVAHEVFVRFCRLDDLPAKYLNQKIKWMVKSVFRDFYTNIGRRKKDVLLEATRKPVEHAVWDENTVDAAEEYKLALQQLYLAKPHWFETLMDNRTMKEIATERNVTPQAVSDQKQHARRMMESILNDAA